MRRDAVVLGVGNVFRHDDGVGVRVVERLRASRPREGVAYRTSTGDVDDLLAVFASAHTVCVVDAYATRVDAGRVRVIDALRAPLDDVVPRASSHAVGVADAIALARIMRTLPDTLVIVAVGAIDFSVGRGLSAAVAAAIPRAVAAVEHMLAGDTVRA